MARPRFTNIPTIYKWSKSFSSIKSTCETLTQINVILVKCIPEEYVHLCHFGSIDEKQNVAILFIDNQQIFHTLRTMSEHILRILSNHNFNFNGILFKVKNNQRNIDTSIKYKKLSPTAREKLSKLAISIGKPELIYDDIDDASNDNEVEL